MSTIEPLFFIGSSSFLQVTRTTIKAWISYVGIPPLTLELAALECLKNRTISLLAPSFLIGYSSFMQVRRTTIISLMSSKFGTI